MLLKCNTCNIDLKSALYFEIRMEYLTMMKDQNTGQLEEVTSMYRDVVNFFCPNCYDGFLQMLEDVICDERGDEDCMITGNTTKDLPWYHTISLTMTDHNPKADSESMCVQGYLSDEGLEKLSDEISEYLEKYGIEIRFPAAPAKIDPDKPMEKEAE